MVEKMWERYQELRSTEAVAKEFGISGWTVRDRLKKAGYKLNPSGGQRKYTVDDDFFKSIGKDQAYLLGYILTDGNILIQGNHKVLRFHCCKDDKGLLEDIRKAFSSNNPIRCYVKNARLELVSRSIVDDLSKWGIGERKTFTATMPNIPEPLFKHFLRGVIDGDGCISIRDKGKANIRLRIINGSADFLEGLARNIKKVYGVSSTITAHGSAFVLNISKKREVAKILKDVYQTDGIKLRRKELLAMKVVEYVEELHGSKGSQENGSRNSNECDSWRYRQTGIFTAVEHNKVRKQKGIA